MKRRILIVIAAALALAVAAGPASAVSTSNGNGYWGCVISGEIDQSICIKDPTPLLPQVPRLPL